MEPKRGAVKKARPYDSSHRLEQARSTRRVILDVARRRFLSEGFAATTIAAIAGEAGVSVDTIYKSFGGKPGLVRAICTEALAGAGPTPAEKRSDTLHTSTTDPRRIIEGWGQLSIEVAPRIEPVLLLIIEAAASDPEMDTLRAEMDDQRLARMTHNARQLADGGHLRASLSVKQAGEILWTYTSPQLYQMLVIIRGWSIKRYGAFIVDALDGALLEPENSASSRRR